VARIEGHAADETKHTRLQVLTTTGSYKILEDAFRWFTVCVVFVAVSSL